MSTETPTLEVAPITKKLAPARRLTRSKRRPTWEEDPSLVGLLGKGVVLVLLCLVIIFPLYTVLLTSFSTQAETIRTGGLVVIPGELTIEAYRQILTGGVVTRAVAVRTRG